MTCDAWEEALEKVGPMIAAASVVVLELYDREQNGGPPATRNPGGYFRTYVRKIAADEIDWRARLGRTDDGGHIYA